ncbi:membrane protein [Luteipulveratus halotolerans]|uniref:Membrane protein n=2 Tax=Luteipulveratus halotolerans TaxID=1631356 RepID=A0A0L6CLJ8_9MICO|nr:membrane protein [Luteipulveratus halotolerans]
MGPGPQGPGPQGGLSPEGPYFVNLMGQEQGPYHINDLRNMAATQQIKSDTAVRHGDGAYFPAKQIQGVFSDKDYVTTLIISWLVGVFGIDRFYLGYTGLGIAKLLTFGGCGVWALVDLIMIAMRKVPDAQGRPLA